jgi:hypothetical protein
MLQSRPIAKKRKIAPPTISHTDEEKEEDIELPDSERNLQKIKGVVDRRKYSNIERSLILDKLVEKRAFTVEVINEYPKSKHVVVLDNDAISIAFTGEPVAPIKKIKKTLVIKDDKDEERREEHGEEIKIETHDDKSLDKELGEIEEELENTTVSISDMEDAAKEISIDDEEVIKELKKIDKVIETKIDEIPPPVANVDEPKRIKRKLKIVQQPVEEINNIDLTTAKIREQLVSERLPTSKEKIIMKASSYYMNNRKKSIQKLNELFQPYKREIAEDAETASCESRGDASMDLFTHQKVVRDYLNLFTPYRGLLLLHGLGSGKTCTSISIAEAMKTDKRIFIMTPASLKMNFFSELKKCGDDLYKKKQYWEFVGIQGKPEYLAILTKALSLPTDYVRKRNGAWLVDITKPANFTDLSPDEQKQIDQQLNEMIRSRYTDINYNGLTMKGFNTLTNGFSKNPFDNAVILIDEAHNFVSRIVNKIKKPKSLSYMLYDYLMNAKNAKVVLLTGTPIINYPNEIGILYNILRGYIKTWTMTIKVLTKEKVNTDSILSMFDRENFRTFDFVEYSGNKLTITRNPFGFINSKKRGVLKGVKRVTQKDLPPAPRGGGKTRKLRHRHHDNDEKENLEKVG